ncbi:trypsin-like peptidase domain-containing protein [Candidatus Parcubacteria bacterium]|nr:trypsin-like peptidase domain-containing protein [Candidatus Parcubacteria bacterium]
MLNNSKILFGSIAILSVIIIGGFYVGILKYIEYKNEIIIKDEQVQRTLLAQQTKIDELKNNIDMLRFENEGKVEEIKKRLEAEETIRKVVGENQKAEGQLAQQKIVGLEQQLSQVKQSVQLSSIIEEWQLIVAYIDCNFKMGNANVYYGTIGSGVVMKFDDEPVKVLTNKHVLLGPAFYNLVSCNVKLSDNSEFSVPVDDIEVSTSDYDWGVLTVNKSDKNLEKITAIFPKLCDKKPLLGDEIVVLGYPGIGSKNSVTATEGIISGFDGSYFITSAKVEQGNSGGAAILTKDNCLLGIPTYASLGQVESLARILDIWTVVVNK